MQLLRNGEPQLNGVFVEIGAMNGIKHSNTKFLEDHFGWYGILIEATPKLCRPLQNSGRYRSIKICSGICDRDYMKYSLHKWDEVNGVVDVKINDTFNVMLKNYINIKCQRFDDIFMRYNIDKIDFFSLDVEGAEYLTLKTFNWSIPVHYWFVELNRNGLKEEYSEKVEELFSRNKYKKCPNVNGLNTMNTCFYLPDYPNFT